MIISKTAVKLYLITVFILTLSVPFINKPVHMGEYYLILCGEQFLKAPLAIYNGTISGSGNKLFFYQALTHPPLVPVYVGFIELITGSAGEIPMHLFFLVFPVIAGISMYFIAKRFTPYPVLTALLFASMPVSVVLSQGITTEIPALAFFMLALCLHIYGIDSGKKYCLFLSGASFSLSWFSEYQALMFVPAFFLYPYLNGKNIKSFLIFSVLPALLFAAWAFHNFIYFNSIHILATGMNLFRGRASFGSVLASSMAALGGTTIFTLVLLSVLLTKTKTKNVLIIFIFSLFPLFSLIRNYSGIQKMIFELFFFTAVLLIYTIYDEFAAILRNGGDKDPDKLFILFLFVIPSLALILLAKYGSGRNLVYLLPSLALFFTRKAHDNLSPNFSRYVIISGIILGTAGAMLFSIADYKYAGIYRAFSAALPDNSTNTFYTSEWGLRYYLDRKGCKYLLSSDKSLPYGSLIVETELAGRHTAPEEIKRRLELLKTVTYKNSFPLRMMDSDSNAGFYDSSYGLLPFSFSNSMQEQFHIFQTGNGNYFIRNLQNAKITSPSKGYVRASVFTINDDSRIVLYEHPPSMITYKLKIPENSYLSFGTALDSRIWFKHTGNGVIFEIYITQFLKETYREKLFAVYLDPVKYASDRKWFDKKVDLSEYGGREVVLTFVTEPGLENACNWAWAGWSNPVITKYGKNNDR